MNQKKIKSNSRNFVETTAELLCDLTRMCNIKEEHFASGFNLSPGEFRLLKLFVFKNPYAIKEICELLSLTPGRITHLVGSLEKKKLIIKKISPKDKRNVKIFMSKKSEKFISNVYNSHIDFHKGILKHIDDEEKEVLNKSLFIIVESFKKWIKNK
jgi:DNA-binding MarR family transcriptional regulator